MNEKKKQETASLEQDKELAWDVYSQIFEAVVPIVASHAKTLAGHAAVVHGLLAVSAQVSIVLGIRREGFCDCSDDVFRETEKALEKAKNETENP